MPASSGMRILALRGADLVADPPDPLDALAPRDGQAVWIDVTDPTHDGMAQIARVFGLHPLAVEDAIQRQQRPKIEEYDRTLFITTHAAGLEAVGPDVSVHEIDLFYGRGYLISAHGGAAPALEEARRRLTQAPPDLRVSDGYLLYVVLDTVVDTYFPVLDALDDHIEDLQDALFGRPEPRTMDRLFQAKRALLHLRRVAAPQRDMMSVLLRHDTPLISPALHAYFRDVYDHLLRITEQIDTHRDLLAGAVDVYLSLTSNRLNEVVKVLTVITAIFASLAVVTGFYGMNFERTLPGFQSPYGVPVTLGLMAASVGIMLAIFRRQGWL
jgi:magnesium transporter